jgi:hypothetical protein
MDRLAGDHVNMLELPVVEQLAQTDTRVAS